MGGSPSGLYVPLPPATCRQGGHRTPPWPPRPHLRAARLQAGRPALSGWRREEGRAVLIGGFKSSNQTLRKEPQEPGRGGDILWPESGQVGWGRGWCRRLEGTGRRSVFTVCSGVRWQRVSGIPSRSEEQRQVLGAAAGAPGARHPRCPPRPAPGPGPSRTGRGLQPALCAQLPTRPGLRPLPPCRFPGARRPRR